MEEEKVRKNNMIYVRELDLREFRGVKELKKPLRFTKFTVLVGRNNSCKTAVLQALSMLPHPETGQPLAINIGGERKISLLRSLIGPHQSFIYKYAGEALISYELLGQRYAITLNDSGKIGTVLENASANVGGVLNRLNMSGGDAGNWLVFVPNDSGFVSTVEDSLSTYWPSVVKSKSHVKVTRELINPTIDDFFTEIIREGSSLKVRKEVEGEPYYIAVSDLGSGIHKALCISLLISVSNPQVILWDDFEAAAHPSLLRKLLEWLSGKEWQVILATHSIDTLNELAEIKPEEAQVIQLKKTPEDVLTHKTLTIEELSDLLRSGIDPRILVDKIE